MLPPMGSGAGIRKRGQRGPHRLIAARSCSAYCCAERQVARNSLDRRRHTQERTKPGGSIAGDSNMHFPGFHNCSTGVSLCHFDFGPCDQFRFVVKSLTRRLRWPMVRSLRISRPSTSFMSISCSAFSGDSSQNSRVSCLLNVCDVLMHRRFLEGALTAQGQHIARPVVEVPQITEVMAPSRTCQRRATRQCRDRQARRR
jgi:hypothetical protein